MVQLKCCAAIEILAPKASKVTIVHTHTHKHFTALWILSGITRVKPIWILLKQETVNGSGISRAICKSVFHASTHLSVFLHAGCPSCHLTNSVKALKAQTVVNSCANSCEQKSIVLWMLNKHTNITSLLGHLIMWCDLRLPHTTSTICDHVVTH